MLEIITLFNTRLETLSQLLDKASAHFEDEEFLKLRLADDMLPLSSQIALTCNQPHNFAQWVRGEEISHLGSEFTTVAEAKALIETTREELNALGLTATGMPREKRLELGPEFYAVLSAADYVHDYLVPNFYFHLVTAYDLLRANGVVIGKAEFMAHLRDRVRSKNS